MPEKSTGEIERTPDAMFRNYDEARNWVEDADLQSTRLILEDHWHGEHIATARIRGGSEEYRVTIANHEGKTTTSEIIVDAIEIAEMMGGWTVVGRELKSEVGSDE